jgi:hypothetical protein
LVFQLPTDLPLELTPFAFLVGLWRGTGVISYNDGEKEIETEFSQTISFTHNGDNYLKYESNVKSSKEDLLLPSELGYWRLARDAQAGDAGPGLLPAKGERDIKTREDLEQYRRALFWKHQRWQSSIGHRCCVEIPPRQGILSWTAHVWFSRWSFIMGMGYCRFR